MTHLFRLKIILICLCIAVGAFVAHKWFKTRQESGANWYCYLGSPERKQLVQESDRQVREMEQRDKNMSEEEREKYRKLMEETIGDNPLIRDWGPIEDRRLETWWNNLSEQERKNHKFAADIIQAIKENNEYLARKKKEQEEESKKQETQKKAAAVKTKLDAVKSTKKTIARAKSALLTTNQQQEKPKAEQKQAETKPLVTIKNSIQKKMTGYKKFGKTWYPDEYSLTIDGMPVAEGEQIAVPAGAGKSYKLVFAYDFRPMGKSYKKGVEQVTYTPVDGVTSAEVTFSWYDEPTITVTSRIDGKQ